MKSVTGITTPDYGNAKVRNNASCRPLISGFRKMEWIILVLLVFAADVCVVATFALTCLTVLP
jgi:hypothetical protein